MSASGVALNLDVEFHTSSSICTTAVPIPVTHGRLLTTNSMTENTTTTQDSIALTFSTHVSSRVRELECMVVPRFNGMSTTDMNNEKDKPARADYIRQTSRNDDKQFITVRNGSNPPNGLPATSMDQGVLLKEVQSPDVKSARCYRSAPSDNACYDVRAGETIHKDSSCEALVIPRILKTTVESKTTHQKPVTPEDEQSASDDGSGVLLPISRVQCWLAESDEEERARFEAMKTSMMHKHQHRTHYYQIPRWIRTRIQLYAMGVVLTPRLDQIASECPHQVVYEVSRAHIPAKPFLNMTRAEKTRYLQSSKFNSIPALSPERFQSTLDIRGFELFCHNHDRFSHIKEIDVRLWEPPVIQSIEARSVALLEWDDKLHRSCKAWEHAMLKLPRQIQRISLSADAPMEADRWAIEMSLHRMMAYAQVRTRKPVLFEPIIYYC